MEELKKHKREDVEAKKSAIDAVEADVSSSEADVADLGNVSDHFEKNKSVGKKHPAKSKSVKKDQPLPQIQEKLKVAAFASVSAAERIMNGLSNAYQSIFVAPPEAKVNFNKEQGFKFFDKGDYEKAKDSFLSYLEEGNEKDANILYMIAMCHKNMEEYKEAIEYLRKADKLEKDDPNLITELGDCLLSIEEYPEAITFLKKASEIHPDEADIYYHLGTCYEKTEQIEEAKKCYKKAIDLEPREAVYYQALGFVYETSGNHKDAIVCFKKAMDVEKGQKRTGGVKKVRVSNYK
ncbi:MAG: tetratricopeptide repeat protein [Candidatus Omnitrophica bacterium]|nr:tetratricopeptide repeat protein [Candidatus Omnitrophota bacterium]